MNTDEIVRDFGDWRNVADVMTAGKIAVKKIARYFDEGITFNQETTLCGKSIMNHITKAKNRGYFIELHYIGVENAEVAKERVEVWSGFRIMYQIGMKDLQQIWRRYFMKSYVRFHKPFVFYGLRIDLERLESGCRYEQLCGRLFGCQEKYL